MLVSVIRFAIAGLAEIGGRDLVWVWLRACLVGGAAGWFNAGAVWRASALVGRANTWRRRGSTLKEEP